MNEAVLGNKPARSRNSNNLHTKYLANKGARAAMYDHVLIPLEHVPPPPSGMQSRDWVLHAWPWERWWIHYLGTSCLRGGWNVEHTAAATSERRADRGTVRAKGKRRTPMRWARVLNEDNGRVRNAPPLHQRRQHTQGSGEAEASPEARKQRVNARRLRQRETRKGVATAQVLRRAFGRSSETGEAFLQQLGLRKLRHLSTVLQRLSETEDAAWQSMLDVVVDAVNAYCICRNL